MYEIQSNTGGYDRLAELSFNTLQQTAGSGVGHSGRGVAAICPPEVSPLLPPPAYSELTHTPPPSYREVMGLESDIESAEAPAPSASAHHEVEAADYQLNQRCRKTSHRCVTAVVTPILTFLIGACCWYLSRTMAGSSP